jgi:hypothetical protein
MELQTYAQLTGKVKNDCGLNDGRLITETELLGYLNEAIDDAEAAIHNLNFEDKYFKTSAYLSLVSGTAMYNMPSNIYANKILRIFYDDGSLRYEVKRIRDLEERLNNFTTSLRHRYDIVFDESTGQPQIELLPASSVTSSSVMRVFYIRNAKKMTTSALATNVCEIPESQNFILAHMKYNVALKRFNGDAGKCASAKNRRDEQYQLMLENLQQMVPDNNNFIIQDLSSYIEQGMGEL